MLAAFAQAQSLTEVLNDYINAPHIQPSDILVKSASLCDDCFKSAEQQLQERHEQEQKQKQKQAAAAAAAAAAPQPDSPDEPTTVINNETAETTNNADEAILLDDDGYCNIDEIRCPAIPLKVSPTIRSDARRQSAPAPLPPPDAVAKDEPSLKSITESLSESTENTVKLAAADTSSPTDSLKKISKSASSTDQSLSISSNSISKADEHVEVNYAYDSLSQPLAELSLNSDDKMIEDAAMMLCSLAAKRTTEPFSMPSIPVHVISIYVAAINQHISQLLVSNFFTE